MSKVTVSKGVGSSVNTIGKGPNGTCGKVTIGCTNYLPGTVFWDGSAYQNGGQPSFVEYVTYDTHNTIIQNYSKDITRQMAK